MAKSNENIIQKRDAVLWALNEIRNGKIRARILEDLAKRTGKSLPMIVLYYREAKTLYNIEKEKIESRNIKPNELDEIPQNDNYKPLRLREAKIILTEIARSSLSRPDEKIKAIDKLSKFEAWESKLIVKSKPKELFDAKSLNLIPKENREIFLQTIRLLQAAKQSGQIEDVRIID